MKTINNYDLWFFLWKFLENIFSLSICGNLYGCQFFCLACLQVIDYFFLDTCFQGYTLQKLCSIHVFTWSMTCSTDTKYIYRSKMADAPLLPLWQITKLAITSDMTNLCVNTEISVVYVQSISVPPVKVFPSLCTEILTIFCVWFLISVHDMYSTF